jgi:putative DNA primase/helicase
MLQGARLVTAQETEEGRRWAEARIKALTGGDPITARYMRQDNFTFVPEFKLVIAGNHKPGVRSVDEALRRRLHLVPFNVTIDADKRDHNLSEKLKNEHPGILKWAIEGCLEWQNEGGLRAPNSVKTATEDYLGAEDTFQNWFDECCRAVSEDGFETLKDLYSSYKMWCEESGEYVQKKRKLQDRLEVMGFQHGTNKISSGYHGIWIKPK